MSNYYQEKLNQIRIALGMEVKMAEATLEDGVTKVEAEAFEPGKKIFVVSETGEKGPAPAGTHTTEDGTKVTVDDNGTITAVELPETEEFEKEEEEENGSFEKEEELLEKLKMKFEEELPAIIEEIIEEKIEEKLNSYKMESEEIIEQIVQDLLEIKEEMSSYKKKMEKLSKSPASSKFTTFNTDPSAEKVNTLEARVDHLKALKSELKPNKRF
jgi:hypothetical protein